MNQKGFTLIEVMITLVISSFILMAAYSAHIAQQKTYFAQDQVAEMQQIHRAALARINLELRMAGFDPQVSGNFGITDAQTGRVQFTADMNEDGTYQPTGGADSGDVDQDGDTTEIFQETFDIGFSSAVDGDGDGIPESAADGVSNLGIQYGGAGGFQAFAENIQAVEFMYMQANGTILPPPVPLTNVEVIQVTVLTRAGRRDAKFTNNTVYVTPGGQNWGPYNDNFRRRLLTTSIRCRNLR